MRWIVALSVLAGAVAYATPAQAAPKVAVVDLVKLMEEHPASRKLESQFKQAQKNAQEDLERQDKNLQRLKQEIDALNPMSPQRRLKEKQYELQKGSAKFNFEWARKTAIEDYVRALELTYRAVRGLVSQYARENGIEIVLLKTDPQQPFNAVERTDFALKVRLRLVLFSDSSVDITDAMLGVISKLPKPQ